MVFATRVRDTYTQVKPKQAVVLEQHGGINTTVDNRWYDYCFVITTITRPIGQMT